MDERSATLAGSQRIWKGASERRNLGKEGDRDRDKHAASVTYDGTMRQLSGNSELALR